MRYIAITGSVSNGHWAFGPFDTVEEAEAFGETNLNNAQTMCIESSVDFYRKREFRRVNADTVARRVCGEGN